MSVGDPGLPAINLSESEKEVVCEKADAYIAEQIQDAPNVWWMKYPDRQKRITTDMTYLRKKASDVKLTNIQEVKLARELMKELHELLCLPDTKQGELTHDNIIGFGLVATQLAKLSDMTQSPPRCGVVRIPKVGKNHAEVWLDMINPYITEAKGAYKYKAEGCLSFVGEWTSTTRYRQVTVKYVDGVTLEEKEEIFYGIDAVVMQHEIDHYEGIIFKDRHKSPTISSKREDLKPNAKCVCGSGRKVKKCDCAVAQSALRR